MRDKIILEDIEKISSSIVGDAFAGSSVLVTGGAGFLGSWLCDILINLGAKVHCVDDFSTGRTQNIDHLTNNPTFNLHKGNVSTFQSNKKFDWIFHFAGHASPEEYLAHPIETLCTSSSGSANIAEIARKNDAILEFASTSEIYGDAEVVPTPENYWGRVNPIGPRSCYDEGKRFAEALLTAYHKQYGLYVKIPRIFNSYGPRLREDGLYGRAMSRFVSQALSQEPITVYGDGTQTRSFCYVTDTITALLKIAVSDSTNSEVINVGNDQEVTILELAKKIKTLSASPSSIVFKPLPKDDPKRRCPDISKIRSLLSWKPEVALEIGMQRTINWFSTGKSS